MIQKGSKNEEKTDKKSRWKKRGPDQSKKGPGLGAEGSPIGPGGLPINKIVNKLTEEKQKYFP